MSLWGSQGPRGLSWSPQIWSSAQQESLPRQLVPISPGTALPHPVLNLRISPDSLQNYSNKSTTSTQVGYTTILLLQSLLPTAPACPLYSLVQPPCCSTSHGLHVLLPGCEYMCLKNCFQSLLPSVGCHVFSHLILFRTGSLLHQQGEKKVIRRVYK